MTEQEHEQLDRNMAERVFQFKWSEERCRICGWPLADSAENGCVEGNCSLRPIPEKRADSPAPYSSEIEYAWLVLEKMRERGLYVGFDSNAASPDVWRFWAQDEEGEYVASGEAPTAPLAACKMALACLAAAREKGKT